MPLFPRFIFCREILNIEKPTPSSNDPEFSYNM